MEVAGSESPRNRNGARKLPPKPLTPQSDEKLAAAIVTGAWVGQGSQEELCA